MAAIYLAEIPNYRARLWCLWWGKEKTKKIAQKGKREERKREFSCHLLLFCIKSAKSGLRSQFQDDYQHSLIYYVKIRLGDGVWLMVYVCCQPRKYQVYQDDREGRKERKEGDYSIPCTHYPLLPEYQFGHWRTPEIPREKKSRYSAGRLTPEIKTMSNGDDYPKRHKPQRQ